MPVKIVVTRFASDAESTASIMTIDGAIAAFVLEDEHRKVKVQGETRIPSGTYEIKLRTVGGFHKRYLEKFGPKFHKGMLWLQDVPGFQYILIHAGNTEKHTAGCLLVGSSCKAPPYSEDGHFTIGASVIAYKQMYAPIAKALLAGERVTITIKDGDL